MMSLLASRSLRRTPLTFQSPSSSSFSILSSHSSFHRPFSSSSSSSSRPSLFSSSPSRSFSTSSSSPSSFLGSTTRFTDLQAPGRSHRSVRLAGIGSRAFSTTSRRALFSPDGKEPKKGDFDPDDLEAYEAEMLKRAEQQRLQDEEESQRKAEELKRMTIAEQVTTNPDEIANPQDPNAPDVPHPASDPQPLENFSFGFDSAEAFEQDLLAKGRYDGPTVASTSSGTFLAASTADAPDSPFGGLRSQMTSIFGKKPTLEAKNRKKLPSAQASRAQRAAEEQEDDEQERQEAEKEIVLPTLAPDDPDALLSIEERTAKEKERLRLERRSARLEKRIKRINAQAHMRMIQRVLEPDDDDLLYYYPGEMDFYKERVAALHAALDELREMKRANLRLRAAKYKRITEAREKSREVSRKYAEEHGLPYDETLTPEEEDEDLQNRCLTEAEFDAHHDALKILKTPSPPPTDFVYTRTTISWEDPEPVLSKFNIPTGPDFVRSFYATTQRYRDTPFSPILPNNNPAISVAYGLDDYQPITMSFAHFYAYIIEQSSFDETPMIMDTMPGIYRKDQADKVDGERAYIKANLLRIQPSLSSLSDLVYNPETDDSNPLYDVIPDPDPVPNVLSIGPKGSEDQNFVLHPPPPPPPPPSDPSPSSSDQSSSSSSADPVPDPVEEGLEMTDGEREIMNEKKANGEEAAKEEPENDPEAAGEKSEFSDIPLITDPSDVKSFNFSDDPRVVFDKSKPFGLRVHPGPPQRRWLPKFINDWLNRKYYYNDYRETEIANEELALGYYETPLYGPGVNNPVFAKDNEYDHMFEKFKHYDPTFSFGEMEHWLRSVGIKSLVELRTARQLTRVYHMTSASVWVDLIETLEHLDDNDIHVRLATNACDLGLYNIEFVDQFVKLHYYFKFMGHLEILNPECYELPPHIPENSGVYLWSACKMTITLDAATGDFFITDLYFNPPRPVGQPTER